MKHLKFLTAVLLSTTLVACGSSDEKKENKTEEQSIDLASLPLKDTTDNNIYQEWYEGHKQIKIKGGLDKDGKRHGVWKFYDVDGKDRSITTYKNGLRHGHTVVYYPNGMLNYKGEYDNDSTVGEWKFYMPDGSISKIVNYDEEK
ncbi:MORN repeat variant [Lishizhenia tianjinensis]|uniref:MORN repeat variant n=1 Tax=Lishizhenia tianjinensis TaxID=477690 RepID=A0A1I6ZXR8_9FLAO|nr:hypothetical protein [Lishizhenia tianjinensis]SFT67463.1 MORN repeat variant [Lishizhenia tianjinensis]